jgi:hypothetical protein
MIYKVTLSCYLSFSGGARLMAVVVDQQEAASPQEAVYLIMERCNYVYVDCAEVALPDGATWQRKNVLGRNVYHVALWRKGRENEFPVTDYKVEADSPLLAALYLMQQYSLTYVASVVVACPDGSTWWKEHLKRERGNV